MGYCYAIDMGETVKFGHSVQPWTRLAAVRTHNPTARMIGYVRATVSDEKVLHFLLRPYRVEREVYRKCEPIERVAALFPARSPSNRADRLATVKYDDGRKNEVREFIRALMTPGLKNHENFALIADRFGFTFQRVRSFWHRRARVIHAAEYELLKNAATERLALWIAPEIGEG